MTDGPNPPLRAGQPPNDIGFSAVYGLLSDGQRRHLLYYFGEQSSDVATVDELVEHLRSETGASVDANQLEVQLVHNHLPRLAAHGVIEYDERSGIVRYREREAVEVAVAVATKFERTR